MERSTTDDCYTPANINYTRGHGKILRCDQDDNLANAIPVILNVVKDLPLYCQKCVT